MSSPAARTVQSSGFAETKFGLHFQKKYVVRAGIIDKNYTAFANKNTLMPREKDIIYIYKLLRLF